MQPQTIIETDGITRTLEVRGVGAGSAMITVTVDDGRGVANSRVSAEFEVQVEANIAPTITLTPSSDQTLPVNSTAHIVVSVADDNFNLDDVVTLEAISLSSRTIVSVATPMQVDRYNDGYEVCNFMLSAEQSGEATIRFIATDIGGLSDSAELSVRVNTAPTISGYSRTTNQVIGRFGYSIRDDDKRCRCRR